MPNDRKRTFLANLSEMTRIYDLNEIRILETIEQVLARVLAVRYRQGQVLVRLNERTLDCEIVEFGRDGHIREIPVAELTGVGNLEKHIRRALAEQAAVETALRTYRKYKKAVYPGVVRRVTATGSWWVDLQVAESLTLVAECPVENQTGNDRKTARVGSTLPFRLAKVRLVEQTRVQIIADRRSKSIPEYLLREELRRDLKEMRVTCRVRCVDRYCEMLAENRVPRHVRDAVARQLGEPLVIYYGDKQEVKTCRQRSKHEMARRAPRVANLKEW